MFPPELAELAPEPPGHEAGTWCFLPGSVLWGKSTCSVYGHPAESCVQFQSGSAFALADIRDSNYALEVKRVFDLSTC